eukprot:CAMPEP_0182913232 /NCGR_PEP_ID=MMETSP0034_2-20130328/37932_1 /TAXON_ID=156128 /ORGANISM="Nephroselmis pyriformis, Strain CCMP717" /LENGTH=166 /DNA_ID=CAMNT_0025049943 /DNA_START=12 /DNA_END=512 /DNA_ORIENTATION=-
MSAVASFSASCARPAVVARASAPSRSAANIQAARAPFFGAARAFVVSPSRRSALSPVAVRAEKEKPSLDDFEVPEAIETLVDDAKEAWGRQEDKPAVAALGFFGIVAIFATSKVLDSVDRLPVIPGGLELVGILYSGWFIYRYLLFKPDRAELKAKVDEIVDKILD